MKKLNKKGFTLAELLIVVAIIAVLVAIAIPVFTTQLEKSRESTDVANIRSAYAAATVAAMNGKVDGTDITDTTKAYFNPKKDGSLTTTKANADKVGQGTATNGNSDVSLLPGGSTYATTTDARGKYIEISFTSGMVSKIEFVS